MVEFTELFKRGVGRELSDIVGKEMYTFDDRGGDSITLRPEMTAPIVRAAIEHNLLRQRSHCPHLVLRSTLPVMNVHKRDAIVSSTSMVLSVSVRLIRKQMRRSSSSLHKHLEAAGAQGVKLELNSLGTPESRVGNTAKHSLSTSRSIKTVSVKTRSDVSIQTRFAFSIQKIETTERSSRRLHCLKNSSMTKAPNTLQL